MTALFGVQLKERNATSDWVFMLHLNETIDQLVVQTVCIGLVLSCVEDGGRMVVSCKGIDVWG